MGADPDALMKRLARKDLIWASIFLVPFFTLASPQWLGLLGVNPCWPILWLLPFALEKGPFSGAVGALCLGFVVDGISLGGATQIPVLIGLGFWWGRIGVLAPQIQYSLNLGLLAWIGSVIFGISLWAQALFLSSSESLLLEWGVKTLLSQAIITGLIAPLICSWLLLRWRKTTIID